MVPRWSGPLRWHMRSRWRWSRACPWPHQREQTGHVCPATTAGLGALLGLPVSTIYHALNQSVLLAFSPRQTRTGDMTNRVIISFTLVRILADCVGAAMYCDIS